MITLLMTLLKCTINIALCQQYKLKHHKLAYKKHGLLKETNACIKKNHLYKAFLSSRSIISVTRYKSYKNKLTSILRSSKKQYYSDLLAKRKN